MRFLFDHGWFYGKVEICFSRHDIYCECTFGRDVLAFFNGGRRTESGSGYS